MLMFLCPSVPVSFDIALVSLCDIAQLQPDRGLNFIASATDENWEDVVRRRLRHDLDSSVADVRSGTCICVCVTLMMMCVCVYVCVCVCVCVYVCV